MEYVRSNRGNALLRDKSGFTYILAQTRKSGILVWRCKRHTTKYGACRARVRSFNDEILFRGENAHNHEPEPY